jgi:hypothetical protein
MNAPAKIVHAPPANDPPRYQTFEKIAADFGFKNTRAVRNWCTRRKVPEQLRDEVELAFRREHRCPGLLECPWWPR